MDDLNEIPVGNDLTQLALQAAPRAPHADVANRDARGFANSIQMLLHNIYRSVVPPSKPEWYNPSPPQSGPREVSSGDHRADMLIPPLANPVQQASNATVKALAEPITDSVRALRGQMTVEEARDFALNAATNLVGPGALKPLTAIFAGMAAKTADRAALGMAKQMSSRGFPREQVWDATGWFKGADDKWRFEIPDDNFRVKYGTGQGVSGLLSPIKHRELGKAYPDDAANLVYHVGKNEPQMSHGRFNTLDGKHGMLVSADADSRRPIAAHELQHMVQQIEGFTPGSSTSAMRKIVARNMPADPSPLLQARAELAALKAYERTAGEVEARNVEKRLKMTPAERRSQPPWLTEDVAPELQIVRKEIPK